MRVRVGVLAAVLLTILGCASASQKTPSITAADAYVAIVRWQLAAPGQPTTEPGSMPIVYVVAENGKTIAAGVQASVIKTTVDDAKVRFADVRDDAVETNTDGEPVKDGGVLLIVDPIDNGHFRLVVPVTVYRSKGDERAWKVTIVATDEEVKVTASTLQPAG